MAHRTVKTGYSSLEKRLNRFPQGAPPSDVLFKILKMLFSEREASLVSLLPIKPFKAEKAAKNWKLKLSETKKILENLAERGILVDVELNGEMEYSLPPPMAGFFEFSMMRIRNDIDQKLLSELFYQYLNVEEDFIRELFARGETQLGRTFVHEPVLTNDQAIHVLDYERATEVISSSKKIGVGVCYCRHKMEHMGKDCNAPKNICMTFNNVASSLTRHGIAKEISKDECMDLLHEAYDNNLVQFGENVKKSVSFICNCCGCCCEAMIAARKFALMDPVHTTNFLPVVDRKECNGCGRCVSVCPVEAMTLVSSNSPEKINQKTVRLNEEICLGCGVCVKNCPKGSLTLKEREERVITPLNGVHKAVMMAIERGKLQNLIFDNRVMWSHRALAAVMGVILKLPPVKQVLATRQVKSRYLEKMISRMDN